MTTEEKAKAYDEVLDIAKNHYKKDGCLTPQMVDMLLVAMFPELKGSEDERIRKMLIKYFKKLKVDSFINLEIPSILAWLEKQEEQKPEVKYIYPKFRVGEEIVEVIPNGYCPSVVVKYIGEGRYSCESKDGKRFLSFPIKNENQYRLVEQNPTEWNEEDEQIYEGLIYDLQKLEKLSEFPISINSYKWLKSRFKLLQPQPKREWSEKDEIAIDNVMWCIEMARKFVAKDVCDLNACSSAKRFIESFCHYWKPSEG